MTWATGYPAPLLQYPSVGLSNPGFETAFAASDWTAVGTAARDTGVFYQGIASCKLSPAAATGYVKQTQTLAAITGWKVTGNLEPWYVYFWARNDSQAGSPQLTVGIESRTAGHATVETFTQAYTVGTDITTDTTWRLYRAGPFTPTTYATVTEMYVQIGFVAGPATAVVYLDNVALCHALDGQDFSMPLEFVSDFEIQRQYETVVNRMESGAVEGTQYTQGLYSGVWRTSPFDVAGRGIYDKFFDYCSDGTPYRLFANQNDYTRDWIDAVKMPENPTNGLSQETQTPFYVVEQPWLEVIREPTTPVQLVVKIEGLAAGAVDVYLTTGAITGLPGLAANTYALLNPKTVIITGQKIEPLTGKTQFATASFSVLDNGWRISSLIKTNLIRLYQAKVTIYEGTNLISFGSFTQKYIGYIGDFVGGSDLTYNFNITSIYERLNKPLTPLTGGGQIQSIANDRTALFFKMYNPVNLNVLNSASVIANGGFENSAVGATPSSWTDDGTNKMWVYAPTFAGDAFRSYEGTKVCKNIDALDGAHNTQRVIYQDYTIISGFGGTFNFNCYILSDGTSGDTFGSFQLIMEGRKTSGTVVVDTVDSGIIARPFAKKFPGNPEFTISKWVPFSISYTPTDKLIDTIRVKIGLNQGNNPGGTTHNPACVDGVTLSVVPLGYSDREVFAINKFISTGVDTGNAYLSTRGLFGSYPSTHAQDSQYTLFTPLRGHVCDVIRRIITTTSTGTNGFYDAGDGVGLGAYIPSSLINNTVFDSERAYTYTAGAYHGLMDYDFTKYLVDIRFDSYCENALAMIEDLCKAFYANLYVDSSGLLAIHFHRGLEAIDGSILNTDSLINEGALFPYSFNRTEVVNQVRYRYDHEPSGKTDAQGSSRGDGTKFLSEQVFTEAVMGDDNAAASPNSLTRFGLYEHQIESRAVRGSGSACLGMSNYQYGNQITYEVARRIITRNRTPSQTYSIQSPYSKRTIGVSSLPSVTSNAMQDLTSAVAGPPTRTSSLMFVESQEMDYGSARNKMDVRCLADIADISNTNVSASAPQPLSAEWKLFSPPATLVQTLASGGQIAASKVAPADQDTITGESWKQFLAFPREYANIALINLYYPGVTSYSAGNTYNTGDLVAAANPWAGANPSNTGTTVWQAIDTGITGAGNSPATLGQGAKWTNAPSSNMTGSVSLVSSGGGNAILGQVSFSALVPSTTYISEKITCTFTSATAFTVTGSVSGSFTGGSGTLGTQINLSGGANSYPANAISFLIRAGASAMAADDTISFKVNNFTTRVYAVANGGGAAPADAEYQLVFEIPPMQYQAFALFWGGGFLGTTQKIWVRLKYMNLDRVESSFSDTTRTITITSLEPSHGFRNTKVQTSNQVASDAVRDISSLSTSRW